LMEDGAYAAAGTQNNRLPGQVLSLHIVYALIPDLKACGLLERVIPGIELVDYDGFVALTEEFGTVQSWY